MTLAENQLVCLLGGEAELLSQASCFEATFCNDQLPPIGLCDHLLNMRFEARNRFVTNSIPRLWNPNDIAWLLQGAGFPGWEWGLKDLNIQLTFRDHVSFNQTCGKAELRIVESCVLLLKQMAKERKGKERKGKAHIAVPAYVGSLAEFRQEAWLLNLQAKGKLQLCQVGFENNRKRRQTGLDSHYDVKGKKRSLTWAV
eukprot:scaffold49325_cov17-Tisochrysis_lutea.AAC.1